MITKRLHDPKQQMTVILVAAAFTISSMIAFSNTHHIWASEGISTQTSCVDNQPCHTMLCSESQPCKVSETLIIALTLITCNMLYMAGHLSSAIARISCSF